MDTRAVKYEGFDRTVARIYDRFQAMLGQRDVQFYVESANRYGGPVLELGSGTGRILLPIARSGIKISGVDISPYMLAVCRQRLLQEPLEVRERVQLHEGNMADFSIASLFSLVILPIHQFQHLHDKAEQISCLQCARRHLVAGGTLILDIFNPCPQLLSIEEGTEFGEEPTVYLEDGTKVTRRRRVARKDIFTQRNEIEHIYYFEGANGAIRKVVHRFSVKYLYRYEAEHLLERCGFLVDRLYADHSANHYGSKYPGDLIFVAKKTADRSYNGGTVRDIQGSGVAIKRCSP